MEPLLRRLFSTFARGLPGTGLLLMRMVCGTVLVGRGVIRLSGGPPMHLAVLSVLTAGAGILLVPGLWTPIAGTLVAIIEFWNTGVRLTQRVLAASDSWVIS